MVKRTTDMELVSRILNHPQVFDGITDDLSPKPCVPDPTHLFVVNEERTGLCQVTPFTGTTCVVHIAALPKLWGRFAPFVKEVIEWGWENTRYTKIIGFTPACNRAALALARRAGFKEEGRITKSFLKNWELYDMIVFGLSKYKEG